MMAARSSASSTPRAAWTRRARSLPASAADLANHLAAKSRVARVAAEIKTQPEGTGAKSMLRSAEVHRLFRPNAQP